MRAACCVPCSSTTGTTGGCGTMIRRTAQQIAEAAEAAAGVTDDTAVERWVRLVVAQVAEGAEALGVSMLHHPHHPGKRSVEDYARRLDEALEGGGIFGCVQIAGERIARVLDEVAGGTESGPHATVLRELWSIVETLEVYGWSNYFHKYSADCRKAVGRRKEAPDADRQ